MNGLNYVHASMPKMNIVTFKKQYTMNHIVNIILFLVCSILFSSCRSSELEIKQNYQNDSLSRRVIVERICDNKSMLAALADTTIWRAKIIWYNEPDSSGKQFKQKEADINYKNYRQTESATFEEQINFKSDNTSTEEDSRITTEVKEEKLNKPPNFVIVLLLILMIAIIIKR